MFSSIIPIFLIIYHVFHCQCSEFEDKTFESLLDDQKIPTIGILHSAYSNSKLPETSWAKCEYCTKCPNFTEHPSNFTTNFKPCPAKLNVLSEKVKHEFDYIRDIWDRYVSEFHGFSENKVFIVKRVFSRNGPQTPLSDGVQILIPEMNVTQTKFKLDKVDFNAVIKPPKNIKDDSKGEDFSWNILSFNDPLQGPRLVFGFASFKEREWKGQGTETTTLWPMKDGLSRKMVLLNSLELVELREIGCACIRSRLESQFTGTIQELEEICRKSVNLKREQLRPAIKLSTCLKAGEETELRAKKPTEDISVTAIHKEL